VGSDPKEYQLEHAKFLAWERDSLNRLYYGLWIVFLGGFVLSLHVSAYRHVRVAFVLVVAFRSLAIAGTIVNFLMQYHAIGGLSNVRAELFFRAYGETASAEAAYLRTQRSDRMVRRCELPLQLIAAAFLLIAFAGSFLVRVP
jgi:hypothetical protein